MKRIREINELAALQIVRSENPISRVALAQRLNLSRAALTGIVQRFLDGGLLLEVGWKPSAGKSGRREVLLTINPDFGHLLAVSVERHRIKSALFNLNAKLIESRSLDYQPTEHIDQIFNSMGQLTRELMDNHSLSDDQIIGMGIAIPGVVHYHKQMIVEGGLSPQWDHFPIVTTLSKKFNFPIFIENNVKAVTLGEYHSSSSERGRKIVCLWLGDGIGMGTIQNRQIVRGETSTCGEIGFWKLINGLQNIAPLIYDRKHRIWGDILSVSNFMESIRRGIDVGWNTSLTPTSTLEEIIQAGIDSDPLTLHLYETFGKLIAHLLSLVIFIINPTTIVLSGPLFYGNLRLFDEIRNYLMSNYLHSAIDKTELRMGALREHSVLFGAGCLVLDDFFSLPSRHRLSQTRLRYTKMNVMTRNGITS